MTMTLKHSNNHNNNATVTDASPTGCPNTLKESPAVPNDSQNIGKVSGASTTKTATILVSKTKTKTGLPLLMKNATNLV